MGLEIHRLTDEEDREMAIADERLYLNATQDKVVKEGDPEAAFLLAAAGAKIPPEYADLVKPKKKPRTKARKPAEDK